MVAAIGALFSRAAACRASGYDIVFGAREASGNREQMWALSFPLLLPTLLLQRCVCTQRV